MSCIDTRAADAAQRVPLEALAATTLRALCDAGYVDHADYVPIARARGVMLAAPSAPPAPEPAPAPAGAGLPPMLQQAPRRPPVISIA